MRSRAVFYLVLVLSLGLYAAALTQDAFCVEGRCSDWPGGAILLFGALVLGGSPANLAWLANPLLFLSWIAAGLGRRAAAVALGLAALTPAGAFSFMTTVVSNEAGLPLPITGLEAGYWLWLASMAIACAAALLSRKPAAASL